MRFLRSAALLGICLALPPQTQQASAQGAPPPPPSVTVAKPVVKDIIEWDDFIGRFEAVDQVEIRARVSGYLDKVHFQDGALVKVGDLLFTIDPRPYQSTPRARRSRRSTSAQVAAELRAERSRPRRSSCARPATSPTSCSTSAARPS